MSDRNEAMTNKHDAVTAAGGGPSSGAGPPPGGRRRAGTVAGGLFSLVRSAALIMLAAVLAAVVFNFLRPEPLPWSWRPGGLPGGGAAAGAVEITDAGALADLLAGGAPPVLLDARDRRLHAAGHIPGALSLPALELETDPGLLAGTLGEVGRDAPLVAYCSEELCPLAGLLARALAGAGYARIYLFSPGFDVWADEGRPVEAGPGAGTRPASGADPSSGAGR